MGLFDSIAKLTKDVAEVALAPVEIAVDMARVVVAPPAAVAKEVTKGVKKMADEITEDLND